MSDGQNYRDWSNEVRGSARAKLAELRAERLARRRPKAPESDDAPPEPAPPTAGDLPMSVSADTEALVSAHRRAGAPGDAPSRAATPEVEAEGAEAPSAGPTALAPTPAVGQGEESAPPISQSPQATAPALPADTPTGDPGDMSRSDLSELPGAGPGLVWLLGRQGIRNLDDLSRADATSLSAALGAVGELLDLQNWIDFADARITGESEHGSPAAADTSPPAVGDDADPNAALTRDESGPPEAIGSPPQVAADEPPAGGSGQPGAGGPVPSADERPWEQESSALAGPDATDEASAPLPYPAGPGC